MLSRYKLQNVESIARTAFSRHCTKIICWQTRTVAEPCIRTEVEALRSAFPVTLGARAHSPGRCQRCARSYESECFCANNVGDVVDIGLLKDRTSATDDPATADEGFLGALNDALRAEISVAMFTP